MSSVSVSPRAENRPAEARPKLPGGAVAAFFVLLIPLILYFQWHGNGYSSETTWHADEPAHMVTSLMAHDWITAGFPLPAMEWAENYRAHYPKVGLGHWPPALYIAEAGWMLLTGEGLTQAVLLIALCSLGVAWLVFRLWSVETHWGVAILAAAAMVSVPPMRWFGWAVMADVPLALAWLGATLAWGRYLDTERWQDNAWFGVWASVAVMTKITGLGLAVMAVLTLFPRRRWRLLQSKALWIAPAWVAVTCAPWYVLAPGAMYQSHKDYAEFALQPGELLWVVSNWRLHLGILVCGLATVGVAARLRAGRPGLRDSVLAGCATTLIMAAWLTFFSHEPRQMEFSYPLVVVAAGWGVGLLGRQAGWGRWVTVAVAAGLVFQVWGGVKDRARKDCFGMDEAAAALAAPEFAGKTVLVSSDPAGEGSLVVETALREQRPGRVILLGSDWLAESDWQGAGYRSEVHSPKEVLEILDREKVQVVLGDAIDRPHLEHDRLLGEALAAAPERWRKVGTYPAARACVDRNRNIEVYARVPGTTALP